MSAIMPVVFSVIFMKDIWWSLTKSKAKFVLYLLLCFFITSCLSAFANQDFTSVPEYLSFLAFTFILAGLVGIFSRHDNAKFSIEFFFHAGLVLAFSVYLDVFQLVEFQRDVSVGGRGAGFAENPNFAILGLLSAFFVCQNSKKHSLRILSLWLFIPAAILTGSRFGFIIVGIYLFSQILNYKQPIRSIFLMLTTVSVISYLISIILPLLLVTSSLYRRLTFSNLSLLSRDEGRFTVIIKYIEEQTFYVFGHGLSYGSGIEHRAHNSFVNYFYDLGFLAGLSFLTFYVLLLFILIKQRGLYNEFLPLFTFVIMCPIFNNSVLTAKSLIMLFAFLLAQEINVKTDKVDLSRKLLE